jgi:predicted TIM-barrel fold metal-dependent hydrolase
MAIGGLKWLDSDMHLCEPWNFWNDYVDPKFRDWIPQWTGDPATEHPLKGVREHWDIAGQAGSLNAASDPQAPDRLLALGRFPKIESYINASGYIGPDEQCRAMEAEGIDIAVLFPSNGNITLPLQGIPTDAQMALAKGYNDWLSDFCRSSPGRLKHNALVSVQDIEAAVAEIRRAATTLGSVSVFPYISRDDIPRLDDPYYEPIWTEAEEQGIAIAFHGARGGHFKKRYRDHVPLAYVNGRGIEHAVTFSEMLYGGVFERHPNLRVAFLEAGCSWIIYWVARLEEIWEKFRSVSPELDRNVRMRPVEYWQRQCFSSVEPEEWTLADAISAVGDGSFVISSDFPHFDSEFPDAGKHFMALDRVSEASKRKILWDNCARLYNLD